MIGVDQESDLEIRPARKEDIQGILAVQKDLLLESKANLEKRLLEKEGFLVYPVGEKELKQLIDNPSNILLVARSQGNIVGYALAYDLSSWRQSKKDWDLEFHAESTTKKHLSENKVLYFRHIARKKGFSGIGEKLEENVYAIARSQGYKTVVGEILEQPIQNTASITIHKTRDYGRIGQITHKDGMIWGVYEKNLQKSGIDKKLITAFALVIIGAGLLFSSSSITGMVVVDSAKGQFWIGGLILLIGLIVGLLFLKSKK